MCWSLSMWCYFCLLRARGVRSASRLVVSLIRLPRCYYYTTCKWCMESHLSSDAGVLLALVPWPPCAVHAACVAAGCVRVPGSVCALPPGLPVPCGLVLWGCALPCSLARGLLCLPLWAGLVRGPCAWASYKPLPYGPILLPCIPGLIWASEKGLYFRPDFSVMYFRDFFGLYFRLKISGQIFRAPKSGFFSPDFFAEIFPEKISRIFFPGFIFRHFFWPDFRGDIWLPLFFRCNIHTIPGSP